MSIPATALAAFDLLACGGLLGLIVAAETGPPRQAPEVDDTPRPDSAFQGSLHEKGPADG